MKFLTNKKGFTLIELLVVISIIGVLSSIILGSLSDARASARDARRLSDIKTIQTALEVYALQNNGLYPNTNNWSTLESLLGENLPEDPINETGSTASGFYNYSYFSFINATYCANRAYVLVFNLEKKNGDGANDGIRLCFASPNNPITYNNAFVVGVDGEGNLKGPDLSGTPK